MMSDLLKGTIANKRRTEISQANRLQKPQKGPFFGGFLDLFADNLFCQRTDRVQEK